MDRIVPSADSVTITPGDARWVGAWWLGYIIAGVITLLSAVPFWFLPKSLPLPISVTGNSPEESRFIKDSPHVGQKYRPEEAASILEMAKEFLPSLKSLLGNPVYFTYLCVSVIQFNSLIGMVTYKPKYIEQHYGQSASKANFLMGAVNIPAVALGMFLGGVIMKRLKLSIMGAAKLAFGTSLLGYFLSLFFLAMGCENSRVAGITTSYRGVDGISYHERSLFADCNIGCRCSGKDWDPVCGGSGITYVSPCLAGCQSQRGSGKNTVFEDCKCMAEVVGSSPGNLTAALGHCWDREACDRIFPYFLALSVISSFIMSLGGTPGYMLLIRSIKPELKSLALGLHALTTRTLAGIPAPIYFGAIIDTTCLKWGHKRCGGKGACRIYNTTAYRYHQRSVPFLHLGIAYLGLTLGLRTFSFFLCIPGFMLLRKQIRNEEGTVLTNGGSEIEPLKKEEASSLNCERLTRASDWDPQTTRTSDCDPDRETRL
ncbi:hypothetical protein JZ751_016840 [Albula glossodonta]|uniref:Solute carrier organic anion transporter family member n=1 Tax=Albula glossodonta TaxID=121402 RepID=A0A8T2NY24_9TELE|nr:hypothetical protein JZ751_016840 [Albula glossodonta]